MEIKLVLGDWSHDGHGLTEDVVIDTTFNANQINTAYKSGTKKIGFDFCKECCCDYEDGRIAEKYVNILIEHGILMRRQYANDIDCYNICTNNVYCNLCVSENDGNKNNYEWSEYEPESKWNNETRKYENIDVGDGWSCDDMHMTYAEIYLRICKLGNPEFTYTIVPFDYKNVLHIGGYGLFFH